MICRPSGFSLETPRRLITLITMYKMPMLKIKKADYQQEFS